MPKVSIIIPTYNRAHLIRRAIQSVLNQTYQDLELIIVDDGSIDNTKDIVQEFQKNNEKVIYVRQEKNKGSSAARNIGIKTAKGVYVAFQDSDDEWLPEKLEKQMKAMAKVSEKMGVVYSGFWRIENNKKNYVPSFRINQKDGDVHKEILKGNFIGTPVALIKKECFEKVGLFDESIPSFEDWELWIRISKYYEFKYISEPLMISYYTSAGVNEKSHVDSFKILKKIIDKHYNLFAKHKNILSGQYFSLGHKLYLGGDLMNSRKYFIKSIKTYPLNIKAISGYLVSFFGLKTFNQVKRFYHKFKGPYR